MIGSRQKWPRAKKAMQVKHKPLPLHKFKFKQNPALSDAKKELQTLQANTTADTLLVQSLMDMTIPMHADPTLQAGHALAGSLKAQLRILYALTDSPALTEADVDYYMNVLDLMATRREFGECALAGIADMEDVGDDMQDLMAGRDIATGVPVAEGVAGVRVEGQQAADVNDGADTGGKFGKMPGPSTVVNGVLWAAGMTPGLHGIVRDFLLPIKDFLEFMHEVHNSIDADELAAIDAEHGAYIGDRLLAKARLHVDRALEIIWANPMKYGVKLVSSTLRIIIRYFTLGGVIGAGSRRAVVWAAGSKGKGVLVAARNGNIAGAVANAASAFPSAEAVMANHWWDNLTGGPFNGLVAQVATWVGASPHSAPHLASAVGRSLEGLAALGGAHYNEGANQLAQHIQEVFDNETDFITMTILNLVLVVAQFAIDLYFKLSGSDMKPASKGRNRNSIERLRTVVEGKQDPFAGADILNGIVQGDAALQNQQFRARRDEVLGVLRSLENANEMIARRTTHRQLRLNAIREDVAKMESFVKGAGNMRTFFTRTQTSMLNYVEAGTAWYSRPGWNPESARPHEPEQMDILGGDPGDLGLDASDDEEEDEEEEEDAPADRSGSIVEQVFAAHAMRRALERAQ